MSYADFTLDLVQQMFGLSVVPSPLFTGVQPIAPTPWLKDTLQRGRDVAVFSEKARSEFIVAPVLLTCREILQEEISIYSGVRLDVDPERGLKGECDFILARQPTLPILQAPLLIILEAKKNDIEEGLGQCAAQMVGARQFNERHQETTEILYGCVTTGETWQFMQMHQQELAIDTNRYFINEVDKILGILATVVQTPPATLLPEPSGVCKESPAALREELVDDG